MKRKLTIQIACFFVLSIFFHACSEKAGDIVQQQSLEDGIPMKLSLGTKALPGNLECDLYLYKRSNNQPNYILSEIIPFGTENEKYIKFLNTDLMNASFRFFFVATVPGNQEISLQNNTVNQLWTDLTITANDVDLSDNWYYGILDKTGSQILADGEINGILERLVGQITLDIFRADGAVDKPIDIINKIEIASVLDRVYQIDMD